MNAARRNITDNPIRVGRTWLFPDGTRLPVVAGGDETAEPNESIVLPTDLNDRELHSDDDLAEIEASLIAEFDELHDAGSTDVGRFTEIADMLDAVHMEQERRTTEDTETAARIAEQLARVHPAEATDEGEEGDEGGDDPGDGEPSASSDPDGAEAPREPEPVTAAAGTPTSPTGARARPRASASATARRSTRPTVPDTSQRVSITAAADLPGVSTGSTIDLDQVARSMEDKARALSDQSGRIPIATFHLPYPSQFDARVRRGLAASVSPLEAIERAADQAQFGNDAAALVAAGGWCTPSVNMYDLISYDGATGLINLPSVAIERGGINIPGYIEMDAADTSLWRWNEDQDKTVTLTITDLDVASNVATATTSAAHGLRVGDSVTINSTNLGANGTFTVQSVPTTTTFTYNVTTANATNATGTLGRGKGCIRVTCTNWTEYRLEAFGLCLQNGNLMNQAFPELTRRFIELATNAHLHRMSKLWIDTIASSAHSDAVTMDDVVKSDVFGEVMSAVELSEEDYRSQHKISDNVILESLFPEWAREAFRASLAMRAGVDLLTVTDAQLDAAFAARNVRPQFLQDYQPMWNGTMRTAWPTSMEFITYPAGDFVEGNGGTINLGVVRDSRLNATNDYTAAWTEDFRLLARRGPKARKVTVPSILVNGVTACCA